MTHQGKKTILFSSACLIAGMAFVAGLLFGGLLAPALRGGGSLARQTAQPQNAAPAYASEVDAHAAELRLEIARHPDEPLNWIHLGNLYFDNKRHAEAIEAYGKALELDPDNADVLTDMGTMHRYSGDARRAVEAYDRAIAVNPRHQNARYNKGLTTLIELADPQGALEIWQDLLRVVPDATVGSGVPLDQALDDILIGGGTHLEADGRNEAALQAYELALRHNPSFMPALLHQGALLEKLQRNDEARIVWRTVLAADPQALTPDGRRVADLPDGS